MDLPEPGISGRQQSIDMLKKVHKQLQIIDIFCNILQNYLCSNANNKSTTLKYNIIATKLVENGIISKEQDQEIMSKWNVDVDDGGDNNIKRLEELILSCNFKLDTMDALKVFIEGVYDCGDVDLGQQLTECCFPKVVHPALLLPEILTNILQYLPPRDLANARLVSKSWNSLANQFVGKSFEIIFSLGRPNQLSQFISSSNTNFCNSLRSFNFRATSNQYFAVEKHTYLELLNKYGQNIQHCTFSLGTNADKIIQLFLSPEQTTLLTGLVSLNISVSLELSFIQGLSTMPPCLANLRHLTINESGQRDEYGQMEFLNKFFQTPNKLKSLSLTNNACAGTRDGKLTQFFKNIFQNSCDLESLDLDVRNHDLLDKEFIDLTLTSKGPSTLKYLRITRIFSSPVTPSVFYRFLVSHQNSLERLTLGFGGSFDFVERPIGRKLLEAIPELPQLSYFYISVEGKVSLNFCNHTPNLKKLSITNFTSLKSDVATNTSLESLYIEPKNSNKKVFSILNQISTYFPNLKKLIILRNGRNYDDIFRIEFSIRSKGFKTNIMSSNLPFVKYIEHGEMNDADKSYISRKIPMVDQIKTILLKQFDRFKQAYGNADPNSTAEIVCLLSRYGFISYSTLRKSWNGPYTVVQICNNNNNDNDIPTFFLSL